MLREVSRYNLHTSNLHRWAELLMNTPYCVISTPFIPIIVLTGISKFHSITGLNAKNGPLLTNLNLPILLLVAVIVSAKGEPTAKVNLPEFIPIACDGLLLSWLEPF